MFYCESCWSWRAQRNQSPFHNTEQVGEGSDAPVLPHCPGLTIPNASQELKGREVGTSVGLSQRGNTCLIFCYTTDLLWLLSYQKYAQKTSPTRAVPGLWCPLSYATHSASQVLGGWAGRILPGDISINHLKEAFIPLLTVIQKFSWPNQNPVVQWKDKSPWNPPPIFWGISPLASSHRIKHNLKKVGIFLETRSTKDKSKRVNFGGWFFFFFLDSDPSIYPNSNFREIFMDSVSNNSWHIDIGT